MRTPRPAACSCQSPLGAEVIVNVHVGETLVKVRTAPDVRVVGGKHATLVLVSERGTPHAAAVDGDD